MIFCVCFTLQNEIHSMFSVCKVIRIFLFRVWETYLLCPMHVAYFSFTHLHYSDSDKIDGYNPCRYGRAFQKKTYFVHFKIRIWVSISQVVSIIHENWYFYVLSFFYLFIYKAYLLMEEGKVQQYLPKLKFAFDDIFASPNEI